MTKKVIYLDMDNTLIDFGYGISCLSEGDREKFEGRYDEHPEIFSKMIPIEGAVWAVNELVKHFDVHIASTAPWENPNAWSQKRVCIEKYFGNDLYKKLTLTHHKDRLIGDVLVDDRPNNGVEKFRGEWIKFGSDDFPDWETTVGYIISKYLK